jgi:uncharacterized tellurite resistance protein B-like protein
VGFFLLVTAFFLFWLALRSGKKATSPATASAPGTKVRVTVRNSRDVGEPPLASVRPEECWIPYGQQVTVAARQIPGGMLYVGHRLASVSGFRIEPALIDPSLKVARTSDRTGSSMTYWPSYSSISPEARAAYLDWLESGRRDPEAYIGYVFLYFYGLERRALADARSLEAAKEELDEIISEVEQLLNVYSKNRSFRGYARTFLDILRAVRGRADDASNSPDAMEDSPLATRGALAQVAKTGRPVSADLALRWYLTDSGTASYSKNVMRRCPRELSELFRARYGKAFGNGASIEARPSQRSIAYVPASASFGGQVSVSVEGADISTDSGPFAEIRRIAEGCSSDLDAFSRWIARNENGPKTVAAVALLPAELATTNESEEAQRLWQWVKDSVGGHDVALCPADELLSHCGSFGAGKLSKGEAVLFAQLLEKGGYGIEPDVRFGGSPIAPDGTVAIFKLPTDSSGLASPQYAAATVLLRLAVAISAADGSISKAEEDHLHQHLEKSLVTGESERVRLRAHLAWLMQSPPSITGLRRRLDPLDDKQRTSIANFIVSVAGADGQISAEEIKVLGKVYPMLGLPSEDVFGHVHAIAVTEPSESVEPVQVVAAAPTTGHHIPSPRTKSGSIRLNMNAVNAKLADSAKISAILDDIFTEEEPIASASITEANGKLAPAYGALLKQLAERGEWSRAEFERMAAEASLMPDGAIDAINEAGFEHVGAALLEGDDPICVDLDSAKELLT